MLKKRIIGVVLVKEGWAVQSFGFQKYLPLGKPECLVENLDRWGADEIFVQSIDRSENNKGPDFELLAKLARLRLKTPLIYGGGIFKCEDSLRVIQSGADRIVVCSLLNKNGNELEKISFALGAQAVIGSVPVEIQSGKCFFRNYHEKTELQGSDILSENLRPEIVSEIFVQDFKGDGYSDSFDQNILDLFPVKNINLILFGGLSNPSSIGKVLNHPQVSAVAIGNFLNYKEHAIQCIKEQVASASIREASFESRLMESI